MWDGEAPWRARIAPDVVDEKILASLGDFFTKLSGLGSSTSSLLYCYLQLPHL